MSSYKHQQVETRIVSIQSIVSCVWFQRGFNDARSRIPFDWRIGADVDGGQWSYERGRLFARVAPLTMPLRINGKINPKALALAQLAFERRLVI